MREDEPLSYPSTELALRDPVFWERCLELQDTLDRMDEETKSGNPFYEFTPEFLSFCGSLEVAKFLSLLLMRRCDLPAFYETLAQVSAGRQPEVIDDLLAVVPLDEWRSKLLALETAALSGVKSAAPK